MRRGADATAISPALPRDPILAGLTLDSRKVKPGYLFAALSGSHQDGAAFVADAVKRGAVAILAAPDAALPPLDPGIVVVRDANPRRRVALMASAFAGPQPATIAAVTGTNGKSSTVHFVRQIWERIGLKAASVGTLGIVSPGLVRDGGLTTPDPVQLHEDLATLAREGVSHLAIEASSHGIDQSRLDGLRLAAAAFTNLTHEHLDYHRSMDAYFAAKARCSTRCCRRTARRSSMPTAIAPMRWPRSAAGAASLLDVRREGRRVPSAGRRPDADRPAAHARGHGRTARGRPAAGWRLPGLERPRGSGPRRRHRRRSGPRRRGTRPPDRRAGRLQLVARHRSGAALYVDYAHKPEALETVLRTLRPFARGKLVVVFGCGGDRDRAKRPVMGEIATRLADLAIVTDDNPRSEESAAIRAEIVRGIPGDRRNWVEIPEGRHAAIAAGVEALAGADDLLLIAGKGHETGQTIKGVTHHFDDAEEARALTGGTA